MKLLVLSFLMAVPTPPGFLLLMFLLTFYIVSDLLAVLVDKLYETW